MSIFRTLLENDEYEAKYKAWQDEVRKKHPDHASQLKFKSKTEKGADGKTRNLISAEVAGQDRCFGVFDTDTEEGEALS